MMNRNIDAEDYILSDELDVNNKSYIYGEVYETDIYTIVKSLHNINTILDVGSGCGKLVIFLSSFYEWVDGVEIHKQRYNKSIILAEKYNAHNIDFIFKRFQDIYFGNYDLIYCCNKIFEKNENNILYTKIANELKGYCILFDYNHILKPYYQSSFTVRTSWNKCETIYLFYIST